jgi:hypothetical protein
MITADRRRLIEGAGRTATNIHAGNDTPPGDSHVPDAAQDPALSIAIDVVRHEPVASL